MLDSHLTADSADRSTPEARAPGSLEMSRKLRLMVSALDASIQKIRQNLGKLLDKHATAEYDSK
jgi:hypothetical protein